VREFGLIEKLWVSPQRVTRRRLLGGSKNQLERKIKAQQQQQQGAACDQE